MVFEDLLASLNWRLPRRWALFVYTAALLVAAVVMVAALLATGHSIHSWGVLALAGAALLAERQSVRLTATAQISVSFLPIIFSAVVFGPLAAIVVGAASLLGDFTQPYMRWTLWTASRSLVAGTAGLAATELGGQRSHSFGVIAGAVAAAVVIEQLGDLVLGSATVLVRGGSVREFVRAVSTVLFAAVPLYTPVIAVLVYAYREISAWSVLLFLIPAFAAHRLFVLYREQRDTAEELALANEHLEKANLSFATALVATLDARDRYTAGHSAAVAIYARDIAARLGLGEEQQRLAHLCGLVHDIGKIGLPPGLLEKPGTLTLEERRQMQEHAVIGERILAKVDDYSEIAQIVRHHHERVDGLGYPDGLCGSEIPLLSRIITVADAYDAMTSDRPYRDAMPSRVARLRLAQAAESQFDTNIVATFEAILAGATQTYRLGNREDFSLRAQELEALPIAGAA